MRFLMIVAMLAFCFVSTADAGSGDLIVRRGLFGRQIVEAPRAVKIVVNRVGACVGGVCNVARRVVVRQAAPVVVIEQAAPVVVIEQAAPVEVRQRVRLLNRTRRKVCR